MRVELEELKGEADSCTLRVEDVSALSITEKTSKDKISKEADGPDHNKSSRPNRIPPNSSRHIICISPGTFFKIHETTS